MDPRSVKLADLTKKQRRWDSVIEKKCKWLDEQRKHRLETRDKSIPDIKDFFAGRSVLITGGTGFLGKAVIEKLMRSTPHINKIYVIVRPKRNQVPSQRIEALFNSDVSRLIAQPFILTAKN